MLQSKRIFEKVDIDSDELRIDEKIARYVKNLTTSIKNNPAGDGGNGKVHTPIMSNGLYTDGKIVFPAGDKIPCGFFESKETNEAYVFVYNYDEKYKFIYRIKGVDGTCDMIYKGACLPFRPEPQFYVAEGRCVLHNDTFIDKSDGTRKPRKLLIFTTNYTDQCCISVEDSAATNSFNVQAFPYFNSPGYNSCELIRLGLPTPSRCIEVDSVPREEGDQKQNQLSYKGWQWRIKFIDVFGRESEWGIISDRYFTIIGGGCIANSSGLARCVKLKIEAGGPLIDKIMVAYRTCAGKSDFSGDSDWYLYDTITKYDNCDAGTWYQRSIRNPWKDKYDEQIADGKTVDEATAAAAGLLKYNVGEHVFEYTFCNDKECQPIDFAETIRTENPLPWESSGVFFIDKGIGLVHNKRGWTPLTCDVLEKFSFSVTPPTANDCEETEQKLRKIVVYANIWNPFLNDASLSRLRNSVPVFGLADCSQNNPMAYDMYFAAGQEGFLGYLAGTPYYSISQQIGHECGKPDDLVGVSNLHGRIDHYLQKFEFKVPPGKYIFRIASHLASPSDEYQKTSTYVKHTSKWNPGGAPTLYRQEIKELVIDVCDGDHLSDACDAEILTIYDLTRDGRGAKINLGNCWGNATTLVDGYIYEDEVSQLPIEYAEVEAVVNGGDKYNSWYTDHNGFFFVAAKRKNCKARITVRHCVGGDGDHKTQVESKEALDNFNSGGHLKHDEKWLFTGTTEFPAEGRRKITGQVLLCSDDPDDKVGISGVLVCVTKGQPALTDANGKFTLVLHNRAGEFIAAPKNTDIVIISQKGLCKLTQCDDPCAACFTDYVVAYIDCGGLRETKIPVIRAGVSGVNILGPQTGGRYGVGLTLYDWMGRHSFIQADDHFYLDIPSLLDTKVFRYSTMLWALQAGTLLPQNVAYFTWGITENLNQDDFLTWSVDKVEFIDGGGNVNTVAPTQIRIYYASLVQYNKQNNFATTTNWQFIESQESQEKSVIGDQIQFLINGDGKWFDTSIVSIVRYDKDGKYITIDYTDDLSKLTAGGLVKLLRPKQCVNKFLYFELCPKIPVVNGVPSSYGGTLNYYDSYFLNRQIPVPVETSIIVNNATTTKTEIQTRSFDFSFEHPSPSDLWGNKCRNGGRINVKNPYERQQTNGTEIAPSKAITENSAFNGLSYFDRGDVSTFDKQEWGNITVVLPEVNLILAICEKDSFIAAYSESDVKIGADGSLMAIAPLGKFARPQRKIGKNFGCQQQDINTIRKTDGLVMFLDRNKQALVIHGYGDAVSINDVADSGIKTWVRNKLAYANNHNLTNSDKIYFHAGIDPRTKEYYLTSFKQGANPSFANTESDWNYAVNETICIDINGGYLKAAVGFTPQYYGSLEGYYKGKNFFAFKQADAWIQYPDGAYSACNFFGVQDKKVITIVFNEDAEKVKRFLYNEVYCKEHRFVISSILTEAGHTSRLLAVHWKKGERFWAADFKCAINTPMDPALPAIVKNNPLFNGEPLSGRWLMATYISEGADNAKYCEVSAIQAFMLEVEKSG